jgi:uncharacterized membrane protein
MYSGRVFSDRIMSVTGLAVSLLLAAPLASAGATRRLLHSLLYRRARSCRYA